MPPSFHSSNLQKMPHTLSERVRRGVTLVSLQFHQSFIGWSSYYIRLYLTQCTEKLKSAWESQRRQAIKHHVTDLAFRGEYLFFTMVCKELSLFHGHIPYYTIQGSTVSEISVLFKFQADKYFAFLSANMYAVSRCNKARYYCIMGLNLCL